ncbi:MAG: GrpB family protein [Acidimicrobiales bacterium]|nr:GrpB family protein [Acidimicrobiales bacterium]
MTTERRDAIRIVEHDPTWAVTFAEQATVIATVLAPCLVRPLEHIGSTAITGLAAKPIVDMVAVVHDISEVPARVAALTTAGWMHAPEPTDEQLGRMSFCFPSIEHRTHHLHVVEAKSTGWPGWLAYRDRLRSDAPARDEYATLKRDLAARFGADPNERDAYRAGKAGFIARITQDAIRDGVTAEVRARAGQAVDAREAESVRRFLELAPSLERPFDEDADPVHVTGSALVVSERGVILLKHKRLGLWLQPGGHIDPGETPAQAAVRESCEETGLRVNLLEDALIHLDVHPGPKGHTHLDLRYLCAAPPDDPQPPEDESPDTFWFGWDDALDLADDGLRGLLLARRPR